VRDALTIVLAMVAAFAAGAAALTMIRSRDHEERPEG
jgi:hypothetical protein